MTTDDKNQLPFERLREFADSLPKEFAAKLHDLLADIDPADDGTPFGWGSQACAEEPDEHKEEQTLRDAVITNRVEVFGHDHHEVEAAAAQGFYFFGLTGKNVNWMTREELLEELDYESLEAFKLGEGVE